MVSKKGYIKTLEAVVAIIMIIVVSYTLIPRHIEKVPEPPLEVQDSMKFINEKIELNDSIRLGIVYPSEGVRMNIREVLESIIDKDKPQEYDYTCAICSDSSECFLDTPLEKNVYVSDVFIASSEKIQDPKIVRIWFWRKPTEEIIDYLNQCKDMI